MNAIVVTKEFLGCLEKFESAGRAEAKKIKEAMLDAQIHGRIRLPPRPETRYSIPNIHKFGVSKGDRLVVQVIEQSSKKTFVFLFAGIHNDTEAWLKGHQDYRWVARNSDSRAFQ
jgi:hypothetical protein